MLELVLRLGLSLALVLGLFWAVARIGARKMGRTTGLMSVRSRQQLTRTASLAVVEVGSRVLVVGVGDGGVRLLTELDPEELEQARPAAPQPAGEHRDPTADGVLAGSVLSTKTWKQAWAAASLGQARQSRPLRRGGAHAAYAQPVHD